MLPPGYTSKTAAGKVPDKTRHTMLGNGWHVGQVQFLLRIILSIAASSYRVQPEQQSNIPGLVTLRPTQAAAALFLASGAQPRPTPQTHHTVVEATDCPRTHLAQALAATHPDFRLQPLEPPLQFALSRCQSLLQQGSLHFNWRRHQRRHPGTHRRVGR